MLPRCALLAAAVCLMLASGCDSRDGVATSKGDLRPTPERPNIVFILADDQAPGTLGFEGNPIIRTPHIDQMAAEGTYFARAYNVIAQCAPSRATLLTGYYPHDYGPVSNDDDPRLDPHVETIAQLLAGQGYRTGMVGKWHLGEPLEKQAGFDYWVGYDRTTTPRKEKYTRPTIVANGESGRVERYLTDVFTDYALDFLDSEPDRRAFLWLAFHAPHEPVTAHPDHPYNPEDMTLPESIRDDLYSKPAAQRASSPHRYMRQTRPAQLKAHKAEYYSMISAIDANVGRILNYLRKSGNDKHTLVVYMSDNGWQIGDHKMFTKGGSFYEELVRTPLLFWQPGTVPAGARRDALVSSLDMQPTLSTRGGAGFPPLRRGYDIWPLVLGTKERLRDEVFMEYSQKGPTERTPAVALVTDRYKATLYAGTNDAELYDLQEDPHEMNNLAEDPAHAEQAEAFKKRLLEFYYDAKGKL